MEAAARVPNTRLKWGVVTVFSLATAGLVFTSPPDEILGTFVRFLYFHGALTWVNLATFVGAAVAAGLYLAGKGADRYWWAASLRYVSLVLWAMNTWMGFYSMKRTWGGIKWDEPRLAMSVWVMIAVLLAFGIDLALHNHKVSAVSDIALALGVAVSTWYVVVIAAPKDFHPDSPVFNSGPEVIGFYLAMTATSAVVIFALASLLKDRLAPRATPPEVIAGSPAAPESAEEAD